MHHLATQPSGFFSFFCFDRSLSNIYLNALNDVTRVVDVEEGRGGERKWWWWWWWCAVRISLPYLNFLLCVCSHFFFLLIFEFGFVCSFFIRYFFILKNFFFLIICLWKTSWRFFAKKSQMSISISSRFFLYYFALYNPNIYNYLSLVRFLWWVILTETWIEVTKNYFFLRTKLTLGKVNLVYHRIQVIIIISQ